MALTWGELAERLHHLSPENMNKPVVVYDADNDELHTMELFAIRGAEDPQDLAPVDHLDKGTPYLMYGI